MTEDEFLERWNRDRPIVEAWGKFVAQKLTDKIAPLVAPIATDIFIRLPTKPRLKEDGSLLTKAFYRDKNYKNPYAEATQACRSSRL